MQDSDPEAGIPFQTLSFDDSTSGILPRHTSNSSASPPKPSPHPTWGTYTSTRAPPVHATSHPTFIPKFSRLRQRSLLATANQLRAVETALDAQPPPPDAEKAALLARARELLAMFDTDVAADVERLRLEQMAYTAGKGLSVVHFRMRRDAAAGADGTDGEEEEWMMLGARAGPAGKTVLVSDTGAGLLRPEHDELLQFAAASSATLSTISYHRPKTTIELQAGTFALTPSGGVERVEPVIARWRWLIPAVGVVLALFFGVGMVASTQRFSPVFLKTYYIVAIFWGLISSGLLAWYTGVFGGGSKDKVSMFLASLALWLVVIQIGQSRITLQVQNVL
ncbi:hypothetical protein EDC01DRAFT_517805 [Geopyxis carbonaria]|nr:hypothetical protein EDC01DRAFT_517805 [Geopyxis carbonaria]